MTITPDQLKPCPFCGGAGKPREDDEGYHYISCGRCDAATRLYLPLKDTVDPVLVAAWNRREEGAALKIAISALAFIAEGYARGDVNHQDYRVKAAAAADDALVKIRAQLPGLAMPPLPDRTWGGFMPGSQEDDPS